MTIPDDATIRAFAALCEQGKAYCDARQYDAAIEAVLRFTRTHEPGSYDARFTNNVLNTLEFLARRTVLASKPPRLSVVLTGRCNLTCFMCCDRGNEELRIWDIPPHIAEEIEAWLPSLEELVWRGGEVFLSKHFERLFAAGARFRGLQQVILSNGLLLDERWIEKIISSRTKLILSIDGVTKKTYENLRRGASFERLKENLALMRDTFKRRAGVDRGPRPSMSYIVMRSNYKEMERVPEFAAEYGIEDVHFIQLVLFRPHEEFDRENLSHDENAVAAVKTILRAVERDARRYNIRIFNDLSYAQDSGERLAGAVAAGGCPEYRYCFLPWNQLNLNLGGGVAPCCFNFGNIAGDITTDSLASLWNSEDMQARRRKLVDRVYDGFCIPDCNKRAREDVPAAENPFSRRDVF